VAIGGASRKKLAHRRQAETPVPLFLSRPFRPASTGWKPVPRSQKSSIVFLLSAKPQVSVFVTGGTAFRKTLFNRLLKALGHNAKRTPLFKKPLAIGKK
jgi:hypothetical protein